MFNRHLKIVDDALQGICVSLIYCFFNKEVTFLYCYRIGELFKAKTGAACPTLTCNRSTPLHHTNTKHTQCFHNRQVNDKTSVTVILFLQFSYFSAKTATFL